MNVAMTIIVYSEPGIFAGRSGEATVPDTALPKNPEWIRVKAACGRGLHNTRDSGTRTWSHTVVEDAGCPNIRRGWG